MSTASLQPIRSAAGQDPAVVGEIKQRLGTVKLEPQVVFFKSQTSRLWACLVLLALLRGVGVVFKVTKG